MDKEILLDRIARGRTDLVFELLKLPDWQSVLHEGDVKPLQWFVYYNDTTALKAVLDAGEDGWKMICGRERCVISAKGNYGT